MMAYFPYTITISQVSLTEPEVVCATIYLTFSIDYLMNSVPFA